MKTFPNTTIFAGDKPKKGEASLRVYQLALAVFFKEDQAEGPDPYQDQFSLTPLTQSYQSQNGYHVFDLGFYSELTLIENPYRICFHDLTQELGLAINFPDADSFNGFFELLNQYICLLAPDLQGFFQIIRLTPPLITDPSFLQDKELRKNDFINNRVESPDQLFSAHSRLISQITPQSNRHVATLEDVTHSFQSQANILNLVKNFIIPDEYKSIIWSYLIGMYPLDHIEPKRMEQYLTVRKQWECITQSQINRSALFHYHFQVLYESLRNNKEQILEVVPNEIIIQVLFNVIMSLKHLYFLLTGYCDEIISILKVFLWMYIHNIKEVNNEKIFVTRNNIELKQNEIECILFWSLIFIIEKGEIRRIIENGKNTKKFIFDEISDFIFLIHPRMYKLLNQKGIADYAGLNKLLFIGFSKIIPYSDCADIWISAMASGQFFKFNQLMIVSSILLNFPNILSMPSTNSNGLLNVIQQIFGLLDYHYIESAAFCLFEKADNIIKENLTK